MMLAEEIASNVNWSLLGNLGLLLFTALMWWDARKARVTEIKQPLVGQIAPPGNSELQMSVKQLNARVKVLEQWRTDLITKLDDDKGEVLAAGEDRARRIYAHVEDVRKEIDGKISDLPSQIVALLKNTGAI